MTRHILFAWELGARWGHLASILPVARALKARGYRITLAAQEPLLALSIPDPPFDVVLAAPYQRAALQRPTLTYADVVAPHGFAAAENCAALITAWRMLFDLVGADLIIAEHAPGALAAAWFDRRPALAIGTGWSCPLLETPLPDLTPLRPVSMADRQASEQSVLEVVNAAARLLKAQPVESLARLFGAAPEFLMTWPELDHYGARPEGYYYGPIKSISAQSRPDWPEGDGPKSFVYLPAIAKALPPLLQALGQLGWPTIAHTSGLCQHALPANVRLSDKPVDMPWLLPQTDLIINRGGHGLMVEAMRAGVRQVHWPDTFEAHLCVVRLAQHKGAALAPNAEAASVVRSILEQTMASQALGDGVKAIADRYAAFNAAAALDELVEDLLAEAGWN
jgi:UDP:flavonoid glycosyltransferase YjiC (YdhE family)